MFGSRISPNMIKETEKPQPKSLAESEFSRRQINLGLAAGIIAIAKGPIAVANALEDLSEFKNAVSAEASIDAEVENKPGTGRLITHLKSSKYVVVAMDDCFNPDLTNTAINIANKARAKMTFFLIGNRLRLTKDHRRVYRRIVTHKHEIQNHTMNHGLMGHPHTWDPTKIEHNIGDFRNEVREAEIDDDYVDLAVRLPGGAGASVSTGWVYGPIKESARRHNLDILLWNLESSAVNRGFNSSSALAARDVIPHIRGGAVFLLHATPPDVSILPEVFDVIKEKRLEPVTFAQAVAMGIT